MVAKAQRFWFLILQFALWDTCTKKKSFWSKPQANKYILDPLLNICKVNKLSDWRVNPVFFEKTG